MSKAEAPATNVFESNNDKCENDFPSLMTIPSKPPSLMRVLDPTPKILNLFTPFISFKKIDNSFKFFGLNKTLAGPPILNQENFDRFSLKKIFPENLFFMLST